MKAGHGPVSRYPVTPGTGYPGYPGIPVTPLSRLGAEESRRNWGIPSRRLHLQYQLALDGDREASVL
eukprot:2695112-Rhodomonas_salina.1